MMPTHPKNAARGGDPYLEQFERIIEPLAGKTPPWVFPLRKAGMARFAELGFPTLKDEDWRFTNIAPIVRLPFRPFLNEETGGVTRQALSAFAFDQLTGPRLVFLNGCYSTALSDIPALPAGVQVANLASALVSDSDFLERHFGRYVRTEKSAFAALNTAFFQDGAFIHVPAGVVVADPIRLLFISTGKEAGATMHPRNLIIAETQSRLTVVESFVRTVDAPYLTNAVTELVAGEGASVEHVKFQDESPDAFHVAAVHGRLGRQSRVIAHSFALGARLSRNNIHADLAGEGLECTLNGLYLTKGEQLADHHMLVEHAQPHCASHEYFNGILKDRSRGVFHGRILVQPLAQKTDAKQTNKNILLSDQATVDTKPQLEIYADDVKCTHGATVGQLNEDSIYYLRSRGIGLDTAKQMLIHAFAGEIIDRVKLVPAREELDKLIWERLEENPHLAEKE